MNLQIDNKMLKVKKGFLGVGLIMGIGLAVAGAVPKTALLSTERQDDGSDQITPKASVKKVSDIDPSVFTPYTKREYPKTFSKFGIRMIDVERARRAAAYLAAQSDVCDRVELSDLSHMTSTRKDIHIFVDCTTAGRSPVRIRFSEAQLKTVDGKFIVPPWNAQPDGEPAIATSQDPASR